MASFYNKTNRNSRERSKLVDKISQDYFDSTLSFYFGRTNLMRGVIDTWNESSVSALEAMKNSDGPVIERTQVSRSTFLRQARKQGSTSLSPYKLSSRVHDTYFKNHVGINDANVESNHSSIH